MFNMRKIIFAAAVACGMSLVAAPASATLVTMIGDTFQISFSDVITSADATDDPIPAGKQINLDATYDFEVTGFDTDTETLILKITVTNNATADFDISSNRVDITGMGFATAPNADSVALSDGVGSDDFDFATTDDLPSLTLIEICASTGGGPVNCSGGGGDGVDPTEFDTFFLTLVFPDLTLAGVNITDGGIKWQTDFGSFEFTGNGNGGVPPPPQVPEPATLLLFGIGLLGLGVVARRQRRFAA